eukprot:480340_1
MFLRFACSLVVMAVDLMPTCGGFWDDVEPEPDLEAGGDTITNGNNDYGYNEKEDGELSNVFDTFAETEDPQAYMQAFDNIKADIRKIEFNGRGVKKLSERYNSSTGKEQTDAIMQELDDIMSSNSSITRRIKSTLKTEKEKNDDYLKSHKGSSVGQWRVNQLNSCTRRFKTSSLEFSTNLNTFNSTLRDKQKRHIDIVDNGQLTEAEKEEMINDYDKAQEFIQEQFQMVQTSDALVDRLAELEERHQGMLKIEKSIKELQEMWMELNVLVTEQQEMLDMISKNVEETRDYVKSATMHLTKAEEHQKTSRKLQLCACCCCLVILIVVMISLGFGGVFTGA